VECVISTRVSSDKKAEKNFHDVESPFGLFEGKSDIK
jgi:hypothetical protein